MTWIAWTFAIFICVLAFLNVALLLVLRSAVDYAAKTLVKYSEDLEAAEQSVQGQHLLIAALIASVQELSPDADIILQHALSRLSPSKGPAPEQMLH